jgi:anti-sigma factor RsiW
MESTNPICKQIDESLSAFRDGELNASEQAVVEEHIKSCSYCVAKLANIEWVVGTLRNAAPVNAPAGLSSKLDSIIDKQHKVVAFRSRVWKPAAAVAAVAAIMIGVRMVSPDGNSTPTVAVQPAVPKSAPVEVAATPKTARKEATSSDKPAVASTPHREQILAAPPLPPGEDTAHDHLVVAEGPPQNQSIVSLRQAVERDQLIAANARKAQAMESSPDSDAIAELPTISNSFADAVGIDTDEDGLYDIQM